MAFSGIESGLAEDPVRATHTRPESYERDDRKRPIAALGREQLTAICSPSETSTESWLTQIQKRAAE